MWGSHGDDSHLRAACETVFPNLAGWVRSTPLALWATLGSTRRCINSSIVQVRTWTVFEEISFFDPANQSVQHGGVTAMRCLHGEASLQLVDHWVIAQHGILYNIYL